MNHENNDTILLAALRMCGITIPEELLPNLTTILRVKAVVDRKGAAFSLEDALKIMAGEPTSPGGQKKELPRLKPNVHFKIPVHTVVDAINTILLHSDCNLSAKQIETILQTFYPSPAGTVASRLSTETTAGRYRRDSLNGTYCLNPDHPLYERTFSEMKDYPELRKFVRDLIDKEGVREIKSRKTPGGKRQAGPGIYALELLLEHVDTGEFRMRDVINQVKKTVSAVFRKQRV